MFLTCKYVLPYMDKQGTGSIVNISSINAISVTGQSVAYSSSKAGVIAFKREVAFQYAPKGIRANVVLPGLMKTPMVAYYGNKIYGENLDEMWEMRDSMSPTGKQGEPWDIGNAALFLASDEAKYISGTTLIVDGCITGTTWATLRHKAEG